MNESDSSRSFWRRTARATVWCLVIAATVFVPWRVYQWERAVQREQAAQHLIEAVRTGFRNDVDEAFARAERLDVADRVIPQLIETIRDSKWNPRPLHQTNAHHVLVRIGPNAIPPLIKVMGNDVYREGATAALMEFGVAAVPRLIGALDESPNAKVRSTAADMLRHLARRQIDVSSGVPALTRALENDGASEVRAAATGALGAMPVASKPALPVSINRLDDEDKFVRLVAANTIAAIDADQATIAIPPLIKLLNDSDELVRLNAASSLGEIGPNSAAAITALLNAFDDKESIVRSITVYALRSAQIRHEEIVPILINEFNNKRSARYRINIVVALGKFGPDAKDAVPLLIQALKDDDLRSFAVDALKQIDLAAAAEYAQ
jgi:HEAT repeat protein